MSAQPAKKQMPVVQAMMKSGAASFVGMSKLNFDMELERCPLGVQVRSFLQISIPVVGEFGLGKSRDHA